MMSDLLVGALTRGVNAPTFLALNGVLLCLWSVIAYMFYIGLSRPAYAWLAPHAGLMLALCTLLWTVVVWFITQTGLTPTAQQQAEFEAGTEPDPDTEEELLEKLRALPSQSDLKVFGGTHFGFDTSALKIQNTPSTVLQLDMKGPAEGGAQKDKSQ